MCLKRAPTITLQEARLLAIAELERAERQRREAAEAEARIGTDYDEEREEWAKLSYAVLRSWCQENPW